MKANLRKKTGVIIFYVVNYLNRIPGRVNHIEVSFITVVFFLGYVLAYRFLYFYFLSAVLPALYSGMLFPLFYFFHDHVAAKGPREGHTETRARQTLPPPPPPQRHGRAGQGKVG